MGSIAPEDIRRRSSEHRGSFILAAIAASMLAFLGLSGGVAGASAHGPVQPAAARPGTPPPCRHASLEPTPADLAAVDAATVCLIDRERRVAHLRPLHPNRKLQRVAANQSAEMVLGDYFGDDSRAGKTPLQRILTTHYLAHAASAATAQNIGWGTGTNATPTAIVAAWMQSPPHRQILLTGKFRDIGVGAKPAAPATLAAGETGATYTVEFGTRRR